MRHGIRLILVFLVTYLKAVLIPNLGFLFNRTFTRFRDFHLRSDVLLALQELFSMLRSIPVLVPYPYLEGLDWNRYTERAADRSGKIYLLGHLRKPEGPRDTT